ncbi:MAG: MBL fold metallo-hydrolase [Phycisphaeraceae bacterium]|nr:MBL fold metallo-hydrolase [Phycisphaeraceae bacterium]
MIPKRPARQPRLGFLYLPPFRVQGHSIAGEASAVQVPELDVCFDIGTCPRPALASGHIGLTHGHMDHVAAMSYYFSQRNFQGLGTGTLFCHPNLKPAIDSMMQAWVDIEHQRTPYRCVAIEADQEIEIKKRTVLRAYPTVHTPDSLGYVVVEKRQRLRPEYQGKDESEIVAAKRAGEEITEPHEVPLVAYTGDTTWGSHFEREDLLNAQILITECTFMDPGDRRRAHAGRHLYIEDIVRLLKRSKAQAVVLTHLSRRTHLSDARRRLEKLIPEEDQGRVFLLMDGRANRQRYEQQIAEAEQALEDDETDAQ